MLLLQGETAESGLVVPNMLVKILGQMLIFFLSETFRQITENGKTVLCFTFVSSQTPRLQSKRQVFRMCNFP